MCVACVCTHVCVCACACMHMHVQLYVCLCVYVHVCTHTSVCACTCMRHVRMCVCECMCTRMCVFVYMHGCVCGPCTHTCICHMYGILCTVCILTDPHINTGYRWRHSIALCYSGTSSRSSPDITRRQRWPRSGELQPLQLRPCCRQNWCSTVSWDYSIHWASI